MHMKTIHKAEIAYK